MTNTLNSKFLFALIVFMTILTSKLYAQIEPPGKKITFGFLVGGNISVTPALKSAKMTGMPSDLGYGVPILGPMVGVHAGFWLPNNLALQTELNYTVKGGQREPYEIRFRYIEIPVVINKNFSIGNASFSAGAGGYAAAMVSSLKTQTYVADDFLPTPYELTEDGIFYNSKYKNFDWGARLNLGYNALRTLRIYLSYEYGLSNVLENDNNNYLNNQTLTFGIYLPLN